MKAKIGGTCASCRRAIYPGDRISTLPTALNGLSYTHYQCWEAGLRKLGVC